MPKGIVAATDAELEFLADQSGAYHAGQGSVAQRLLASNFDVQGLRTNAVLRKDEWIQFDEAVVDVARERLIGVADLFSRGLTFPVTNALGTTRVEWEKLSNMDPAEVSMAGVTRAQRDRVEYTLVGVPLPIVHKEFQINIRALEASRRRGETLDTTQARVATRLVAEKNEDILFNGVSLTAIGSTIYGYTTAPDRNTGALTDYAVAPATRGTDAVQDILSMIAALEVDNMFGPYGLYIPQAYWTALLDDYKSNSDKTTLERIEAIPQIQFVRPSARLTGNVTGTTNTEFILVQLTSDVVDMVDGQQPTPVQWDALGGFQVNFKVFSIMVPRIRSDADLRSGIAHFTVP